MSNTKIFKTTEEAREHAKLITNGEGEYALIGLKQNVKALSDYTCQHCHQKFESKFLHTHHIIPSTLHNKRIDTEDNLICLCNSCHQQLHGLIRDLTDEDEIINVTNGYLSGEIKSYKEKLAEKLLVAKERQLTINCIVKEIKAISLDIKKYTKLINEAKAKENTEPKISRKNAIEFYSHLKRQLKADKIVLKARLKALRGEKHKKAN